MIPELARSRARGKVLVVSSQAAPSSVRRALSAGAAGYLPKRSSDRELVDCDPARRRTAAATSTPSSARSSSLRTAHRHSSHSPNGSATSSTCWPSATRTRRSASKLFISVRTVDTHRAHIMRKLQLETRAELVMFALANGVIGPQAAWKLPRSSDGGGLRRCPMPRALPEYAIVVDLGSSAGRACSRVAPQRWSAASAFGGLASRASGGRSRRRPCIRAPTRRSAGAALARLLHAGDQLRRGRRLCELEAAAGPGDSRAAALRRRRRDPDERRPWGALRPLGRTDYRTRCGSVLPSPPPPWRVCGARRAARVALARRLTSARWAAWQTPLYRDHGARARPRAESAAPENCLRGRSGWPARRVAAAARALPLARVSDWRWTRTRADAEVQFYSASEAAKMLGISTRRRWRRWDTAPARDCARQRQPPHRGGDGDSAAPGDDDQRQLSARNRLNGTVARRSRWDGLLVAQVELVVDEPARLVAIVTADAVEELGLRAGMPRHRGRRRPR